jgi:hypothetical protein
MLAVPDDIDSPVPITVLEQYYISRGVNPAFQHDMDRKFRLFLDEQATQPDQEDLFPLDPYCYRRSEVFGYTTSPLGRIVPVPIIEWYPVQHFFIHEPLRAATAVKNGVSQYLSVSAQYASLQGLPYVSPYGIYHVDNYDMGESGRHHTANMRAGLSYRSEVANDTNFYPLLRNRVASTHSNLLTALAVGMNWHKDLTTDLVEQLRSKLKDVLHTLLLDLEEHEQDVAKYLHEDALALFVVMYECKDHEITDFIGDIHLAQALSRWLIVLLGINICLITPMGTAATCELVREADIFLAWEPASRSWNVWPRCGPTMGDDLVHKEISVLEWELFTADHKTSACDDVDFNSWRLKLHQSDHRRFQDYPMMPWRCMWVPHSSDRWIQHVQTHHLSMGISTEPLKKPSRWFMNATPLLFEGNV